MKKFNSFLTESLNRDKLRFGKNDLTNVKVVYHWLTEGKLFDACYGEIINDSEFILNMSKMPPLPTPIFLLDKGDIETCLTIDPEYYDPAYNEEGIRLVMDFEKLNEDFDIENLTDNGEAEIRIMKITNWNKYLLGIDINDKVYNVGNEWDEFSYRAVKKWLPKSLKKYVNVFDNFNDLIKY